MGEIQYALSVYEYLINYKYKFVISHRKTVYYLELRGFWIIKILFVSMSSIKIFIQI